MSESTEPKVTELQALKSRADKMGVKYAGNVSLKKLKELVENTLNGVTEKAPTPAPKVKGKETPLQRADRKRKEARQLVRVNIMCMDPSKREYEGEIFTVSNSAIGSIKRYVPYNAENGWHIERAIFNILKEKQCQVFRNKKDARGRLSRVGSLIKAFAIEELPPLTHKELKELGQRQAMANGEQD